MHRRGPRLLYACLQDSSMLTISLSLFQPLLPPLPCRAGPQTAHCRGVWDISLVPCGGRRRKGGYFGRQHIKWSPKLFSPECWIHRGGTEDFRAARWRKHGSTGWGEPGLRVTFCPQHSLTLVCAFCVAGIWAQVGCEAAPPTEGHSHTEHLSPCFRALD